MSFWGPYISQAERKKQAKKKVTVLQKKGIQVDPVVIEGRAIAKTFWGKSWCDNLENYSDYENRLPRGRTYVRNGSVIDLKITAGKLLSLVSGSDIYKVQIDIKPIQHARWDSLVQNCNKKITSVFELLQGKFSKSVMEIVTEKKNGLFPLQNDLKFSCSCLDFASMCKHVAATLYGAGARLDEKPDLLFILRGVDSNDLITSVDVNKFTNKSNNSKIKSEDISKLFNIDLEEKKDTKIKNKKEPQEKSRKNNEKKLSKKKSIIKKESLKKTMPRKNSKKNPAGLMKKSK
ncbi:hypothetical protein [Silvanigrella sp.]|jgi:uncharacterized Zn finger protein|uniref:hypothetical protein n=1 Tax=Silvanigrella sp. TaxID=2024976 RepID=UPI0037C9B164|nr:hypothetical protein [Silvanigrellaceae bacterium]